MLWRHNALTGFAAGGLDQPAANVEFLIGGSAGFVPKRENVLRMAIVGAFGSADDPG